MKARPTRELSSCKPKTLTRARLRLYALRDGHRISPTTDQQGAASVLDSFWLARGVHSPDQRTKLVEIGVASQGREDTYFEVGDPLPGANAFWQIQTDATQLQQVQALSARLLHLHALLGSRPDINVAIMMASEPRLLCSELSSIAARLVAMRTAPGAELMDIGKAVEAQPALLLQDSSVQDSPEAWSHGVASDSDAYWQSQLMRLEKYGEEHGHVHVGFQSDNDAELCRFVRMQRVAHQKGTLADSRKAALEELGFIFNAGDAEWEHMFHLLEQSRETGQELLKSASRSDFLLANWCSIQRISQRNGVLTADRKARLDTLDFDWNGADALS